MKKNLVTPMVFVLIACGFLWGYDYIVQDGQVRHEGQETVIEEVIDDTPVETKNTFITEFNGDDVRGYTVPRWERDVNEVVIDHYGYTVSHNPDMNIPHWVGWMVNADRLIERESRSDKFLPDPKLPEDKAVTTNDYKGSGYDRGHMCPAADNKYHWRAMDESFYMTNMAPQLHNLNAGDWKELEDKCRDWASEGQIYIVCGPVLEDEPVMGYIEAEHRVRIPEGFFKVILADVGGSPRAVGFYYKHEAGSRAMSYYARSVDEIEQLTGLDFFHALPDSVETEVESQYNLSQWGIE